MFLTTFGLAATEKGTGAGKEKASTSQNTLSNMAGGRAKDLPSFWVPVMTPDSKPIILPKPDTTIYCPVSGKVLKMKDLIDIKFTLAPNDEKGKSIISRKMRYICPITRDVLGNSVPCAVLKPTSVCSNSWIFSYSTNHCQSSLCLVVMSSPWSALKS